MENSSSSQQPTSPSLGGGGKSYYSGSSGSGSGSLPGPLKNPAVVYALLGIAVILLIGCVALFLQNSGNGAKIANLEKTNADLQSQVTVLGAGAGAGNGTAVASADMIYLYPTTCSACSVSDAKKWAAELGYSLNGYSADALGLSAPLAFYFKDGVANPMFAQSKEMIQLGVYAATNSTKAYDLLEAECKANNGQACQALGGICIQFNKTGACNLVIDKCNKEKMEDACTVMSEICTQLGLPGSCEGLKADKVKMDLYVMSFCPYGIQMENTVWPVKQVLKGDLNVVPHFIVDISGTTVDSLHGEVEVAEDKRQACIYHEKGEDAWWSYVSQFNSKIAEKSGCSQDMNCTNGVASEILASLKISEADIDACAASKALDYLKADNALTTSKGVTGSPTVYLNDKMQYSGERTPAGIQSAVCNLFNKAPASCGTSQNTTGTGAAGSC